MNFDKDLPPQKMKLFNMEHSHWAYRFDLLFYGFSPWVIAYFVAAYSPIGSGTVLLVLTCLGIVMWSLLEYVLHRFILHGVAPFSRWHAEHHQRPMAWIFLPTAFSLGLIFLLVFLPNFWRQSFWPSAALTLGVLTGYAAYTLLHHATHHSKSQNQWFRARQRNHAIHHAMSKKPGARVGNFGVTSNLWDRIFRTRFD